MDTPTKQADTTGSGSIETPILASVAAPTAEHSKPAPTKSGSASINVAGLIALLQNDLFALRSKGLTVAIIPSENGDLHMGLRWKGHKLGLDKGNLTVDGQPVTPFMEAEDA